MSMDNYVSVWKPVLCIGSTSSGKSTFANALLGEDILPTSYNAATRVLCEIKHGTRKKATLHLEQDGKQWKETVDLSRAEGRRKFEDVTSPKRGPTFLSPLSGTTTCSRVEVFLPIEFLKVCLAKDFHDSLACNMYLMVV